MTARCPLVGLRVVELANLAPVPFAATVLADLGAEVLRVDRPADAVDPPPDPLARGRRSVPLDLKRAASIAAVLRLIDRADVLIEGFRPGVCERLGVGPQVCLERNPRLVYARLTGWGHDGPLAPRAGHDINYLVVAGALEPIGPADAPPVPPINYVADFGGGGMLCVVGILAALYERQRSGLGQVVDAAMIDGSALLTAGLHGLRTRGLWPGDRGSNLLDGGAPFYRTYACADGRFVAVGAIEPKFYTELLAGLGLVEAELPTQDDRARWPELAERFAAAFATKTRDEWARILADRDACVTPVLSPAEAPDHPHNRHREVFTDVGGMCQPGVAPRFSRTPGCVRSSATAVGRHTEEALRDWGFSLAEIAELDLRGEAGSG